jgi:hypothetical protein
MIGHEISGQEIFAHRVLGDDKILQIDVERPRLLRGVEMKRLGSRGLGREDRSHDRKAEDD